MPTTPVTDWGAAFITSVSAALALFLGAIPKVIGFLIILAIGWFVANVVATLVTKLLRTARFDQASERAGLRDLIAKMGLAMDGSRFIGEIAKWFVRLITLVVAFDALGLPAVSGILQSLLLWLPNLVVALLVLVIGGLAANGLARLVRGTTAESGLGDPDLLANVARVMVWAFAVVIAINQIGVATTLVNTLFAGAVLAAALALGLAFGLGGRETAGRIVSGWYERSSGMGGRLATTAQNAPEEMREMSEERGNGRPYRG